MGFGFDLVKFRIGGSNSSFKGLLCASPTIEQELFESGFKTAEKLVIVKICKIVCRKDNKKIEY